MQFEWDEAKNLRNIAKHGISFERAVTIFAGHIISVPDAREDYGENRLRTIGCTDDAVLVLVVHTDRKSVTRVISARPASRKERKDYEEYTQENE